MPKREAKAWEASPPPLPARGETAWRGGLNKKTRVEISDHKVLEDDLLYHVKLGQSIHPEWYSFDRFASPIWGRAIDRYWTQRSEADAAISDPYKEYSISKILWHRTDATHRDKTLYLVRWKGYSHTSDSWLDTSAFGNAREILSEYRERRRAQDLLAQKNAQTAKAASSTDAIEDEEPVSKKRKIRHEDNLKSTTGSGSPVKLVVKLSTHVKTEPTDDLQTPTTLSPQKVTRLSRITRESISELSISERITAWLREVYQEERGRFVDQEQIWQAYTAEFGVADPQTGAAVEKLSVMKGVVAAFPSARLRHMTNNSRAVHTVSGIRIKSAGSKPVLLLQRTPAKPKAVVNTLSDPAMLSKSGGKRRWTNELKDLGNQSANKKAAIDIDDADSHSEASVAASLRVSRAGALRSASKTSSERRRSSRITAHTSVKGEEDDNASSSLASSKLSLQRRRSSSLEDDLVSPELAFLPFTEVDVAMVMRQHTQDKLNERMAAEEPYAAPLRLLHETSSGELSATPEKLSHAAPLCNFSFSSSMIYTPGIEPRKPMKGCNCVGACSEDRSCLCWRRQAEIVAAVAKEVREGFAYDENGLLRFRVGDSLPIMECSETCGCSSDCVNRQVGRGRSKDVALDLVHAPIKGWGVRLAENSKPIPAGAFLFSYTGEIIDVQEADKRDKAVIKDKTCSYLFDLDFAASQTKAVQTIMEASRVRDHDAIEALLSSSGEPMHNVLDYRYCVDAMAYGNLSRFINHSCLPNLYMRPVFSNDVDVMKPLLAFFAHRRIEPGEELCISYKGDKALIDHDNARAQGPARKIRQSRKRKNTSGSNRQCVCGSINCDGSMFNHD